MNKLDISIGKIMCQVYMLPFVKITHDPFLNGRYEVIIGWLKWELVLGYEYDFYKAK